MTGRTLPPAYLRFRHGIQAFDGELEGVSVSTWVSAPMPESRDAWAACPCGSPALEVLSHPVRVFETEDGLAWRAVNDHTGAVAESTDYDEAWRLATGGPL